MKKTCNARAASKGFCFYKATNGINIDYFKSKPVTIPKSTILLDHGYYPEHLTEELEKAYPQIMTKIKFELSTKPSKQEKGEQGKSGFVPAIARWVVERSNAWMERRLRVFKTLARPK